tara:strand:- start:547 stop:1326 length:780 start_codon:yes stop_codon:yes gene_type:complete
MRISISITGQFRDYNKTFESIIHFCTINNIDIFLLIDNSEKKEEISDIISLSNPVDVKYVDSINDCGNINMWYKIKKGYEQIKEYENKNNFKYDFYIRCRYDLLINNFNVDFNILNKDTLYFGKKDYNLVSLFISKYMDYLMDCCPDEFFISGEKNMNIYCNLYDNLIYSNNRCLENHTSENQFYYFVKFYYTYTEYLDIKYRWACFSDLECMKYHYSKREIYKGAIKSIMKLILKYLLIIFIIIFIIIILVKMKISKK